MTPEKKVKEGVVKILKECGAYYTYASTHGFGKSGTPDILTCVGGLFFGIECKAGSNKPTPLQRQALLEIKRAGGVGLVINEDCLEWLRVLLPPINVGRTTKTGGVRRVQL